MYILLGERELFVSHTLATLLIKLAHDSDVQTIRQEVYNKLYTPAPGLLTTSNIEDVLGTLLDPMSFPDRHKFTKELNEAYRHVKNDKVTSSINLELLLGAIGLICFTLELLNVAEWRSRNRSSPNLDWPKTLIKEPAVQYWFKEVYAPPQRFVTHQNIFSEKQEKANLENAQKYWQNLNFKDLQLYKAGTTSFILHGISILSEERLVLKCLLFPYIRIPAIRDATRCYALKYPKGSLPEEITPSVRSSTDKWILMVLVDGSTLSEILEERKKEEEKKAPPLLRIDLLNEIGKPLLEALTELANAKDGTGISYRHEDLSPSNIIVVKNPDHSVKQIVLIDLGRNYLYSRDIKFDGGGEALYVAKEIKDDEKSEDTSDLYSFGMILIELADPIGARKGTISDSLYQYAPQLARFIEDLIDDDPKKRRLIFRMKNRDPYFNLCNTFTDLLKILPSEQEVNPGRFFWVKQFFALFYPSRRLTHARELWHITRSSSGHKEIARYSGRLYAWLVVNMISSWLIFVVSIVWGARDFGMNPFLPFYITIPQTLIPHCGGVCWPLIDGLQAPGYAFGITNMQARLVGFSVGLTQPTYYANILAGLTTRPRGDTLSFFTEVFLRLMTIAPLPLILISDLYQPALWPVMLLIGLLVPALTNILCYQLAIRTLKEASGKISTAPTYDPSLKNFGQWGTTLFFYIIVVLLITIGLHFNILHDIWAYAIGAVVINVFVFCISKSIILAPGVRGSLSRAFTLGERLDEMI